MDINDLTIGQARELTRLFGSAKCSDAQTVATHAHDSIPVVVCTDKRGVVFGYCDDASARPIILTKARMCLYWSAEVGGVFGLGEKGPTKDCKISAVLGKVSLEGVTAIFSVEPSAEKAWNDAKVQGR